MITPQATPSDNPQPPFDQSPVLRNDFTSDVQLIQMDIALKDDRSPIGWVFGTFMYDGSRPDADPWYRLMPVGLMWGNDPKMTQAAYDAGCFPTESWINPAASELLNTLGGTRPFWGWNRRLNGPADNFISSCVSCHSTAGRTPDGSPTMRMTPPHLVKTPESDRWAAIANNKVPEEYRADPDAYAMKWFENVPAGGLPSISRKDALSADYSLQLALGWDNYRSWRKEQERSASAAPPGRRVSLADMPPPDPHHTTDEK
ncbi:hypothetical protein PUNSTDRAFT_118179 [Punctularia strigosozonata HHB-11173 SS5]|uniref:uncharacterized protein n=1 Tax=Punctularia strigosozonata (strain HHB-11173) TaxID=741275 RepID=UPI00044173A5|nr:uncharacterized protein PUNSTDRAFT_118179 [Punctularia strigosozonata HHB-11173 SS5]EIN12210.1 hypothetical protein PUNSTDRAFT_118179 [Punctularia strigosozonata HHB-11173 SS5]